MALDRRHDRGGFGIAVIVVTVLMLLMAIMALTASNRSGSTRRHAAAAFAGRLAEHYARSAIEESLSTLTADALFGAGAVDAAGHFDAAFLQGLDDAGNIRRDDAGTPIAVDFPASMATTVEPEATRQSAAEDKSVKEIAPVTVQPVRFVVPNRGIVRLEARVKIESAGMSATRFLVEERQVAVDPSRPGSLKIDNMSLRTLLLRQPMDGSAR